MSSRFARVSLAAAALAATVSLSGCGLISSDIASITFDLPTKSYSFDTASGMWKLPPGGVFPEVLCGEGQAIMDCCAPPEPLPKPDCEMTPLSCEMQGDKQLCTLRFRVTVARDMDLKQEVPQLRNLSSQSLVNVTIKQIRYTYDSTMNVDLPPVDLFIAPMGVTSGEDPTAQRFGTVPTTPAGASGQNMVVLDANAGPAFSERARNFGTPFTFIATTQLVIPSGSPIPSGRVDLAVTGSVSAGL